MSIGRDGGVTAISGQVSGHWAGIPQGDNQEGSLESHKIPLRMMRPNLKARM